MRTRSALYVWAAAATTLFWIVLGISAVFVLGFLFPGVSLPIRRTYLVGGSVSLFIVLSNAIIWRLARRGGRKAKMDGRKAKIDD